MGRPKPTWGIISLIGKRRDMVFRRLVRATDLNPVGLYVVTPRDACWLAFLLHS